MLNSLRFKRNVFNRLFNVAMGIFLSGSIKLYSLRSIPSKAVVTNDRDLNCNFSVPCVWYSEGSGKQQWNVAEGQLDPLVWFTATSSNQQPADRYAYVQLLEGESDRLSSAIMPCQKGNGLLSFNYWLSPSATVFGCALDASDNSQLHCSSPLQRSQGKAHIKILGPIYIPFKLAIITSGQGFVIVDEVTFIGDICQDSQAGVLRKLKKPVKPHSIVHGKIVEAKIEPGEEILRLVPKPDSGTESTQSFEEFTIGTNITSTVLPTEDNSDIDIPEIVVFLEGSVEVLKGTDNRESGFLKSSDDLICDFSGKWPCRWGSNQGFLRLNGDPHPEAWNIWTGSDEIPDMPAGIFTSPGASFTSDLILCQKEAGQVMLKWWATPNVKIRVCARKFPGLEEIKCTGLYDQNEASYPGPTIFEFTEQIIGPFAYHIETQWDSEDPGFLILDDIAYFAPLCTLEPLIGSGFTSLTSNPSTTSLTTTPVRTTTRAATTTTVLRTTTTSRRTHGLRISEKLTLQPRKVVTRSTRPTTGVTVTPPLPSEYVIPDKESCRKLNCDFEDNMCGYRVVDVGSAVWQRKRRGFGSPLSRLTDIRIGSSTGSYLGVHLLPTTEFIAILESPSFSPNGIKIFEFRYYRAMHGITLKLCLGTDYTIITEDFIGKSCQKIIPELNINNARRWNYARALIMPKYTKMFLVAEHSGRVRGHGAMGLDNLRVLNC